jgi:allantoicase
LPRASLQPDCNSAFDQVERSIAGVTHARLNIFPDGGVARLRLFGRPE